jgi:hypothetical protein
MYKIILVTKCITVNYQYYFSTDTLAHCITMSKSSLNNSTNFKQSQTISEQFQINFKRGFNTTHYIS